MRLLLCVLLLASGASAQFTATDDVQITGQVGVQTEVPRARFEVRLSTNDSYGLRVSSQNGAPLLLLDAAARLGIGLSTPAAQVDVAGDGDNGDLGLLLRVGNSSSSSSSSQLVFAYNSTESYRHSIRSRHVAGQNLYNALDFYLWRSTGHPTILGDYQALSLQAIPAASSGSVHILPAGDPDVELEISNGVSTGGGLLRAAAIGVHSSRRELKSDIAYLGVEDTRQAVKDVAGLQHATFRYRRIVKDGRGTRLVADPGMPLSRGLIYEDAPESIRGSGQSIVLDERVINLELALQEINRRIAVVEEAIRAAEEAKKRSRR